MKFVLVLLLAPLLAGCLDGCHFTDWTVFINESPTARLPRLEWVNLTAAKEFPAILAHLRAPHPPNTLYGYGGGGYSALSPGRAALLHGLLEVDWARVSDQTLPEPVPLWFEGRAYGLRLAPPPVC
jgi:hypothetical protein